MLKLNISGIFHCHSCTEQLSLQNFISTENKDVNDNHARSRSYEQYEVVLCMSIWWAVGLMYTAQQDYIVIFVFGAKVYIDIEYTKWTKCKPRTVKFALKIQLYYPAVNDEFPNISTAPSK